MTIHTQGPARIAAVTALVATLSLTSSGGARAEPMLIVHGEISAETISRDELERIYLGRSSRVDGTRVKLAALREGETHAEFTSWLLRKSPDQFLNHWRKIVFSGKGALPKQLDSESAMVEFVGSTPGAIGYVEAGTPHPGAKVLRVE